VAAALGAAPPAAAAPGAAKATATPRPTATAAPQAPDRRPPAGVSPAIRTPAARPPVEELRLFAFTLSHQRAAEALPLVSPLLSPRGTVELQAGTNTLVVRDSLSALARVRAALAAFDHPARPIAFDVQIVRADRGIVSPAPPPSVLDPELATRLERLFRYRSYHLLARARLATRESEEVDYELSSGYRLTFKLGTMADARRIKLHGFRIVRRAEPPATGPDRELIHTAINLWRGQPLILGLARDEGAPSALLVVVTFLPAEAER
jgi:hypothetical protein